jgi:hypothetical protein
MPQAGAAHRNSQDHSSQGRRGRPTRRQRLPPPIMPPAIAGPHPQPPPLHCTVWVTPGTALMIGPPIGAALAAPACRTAADTARIRSEVDMVVSFRLDAQIARSMISETGGCCQVKLSIFASEWLLCAQEPSLISAQRQLIRGCEWVRSTASRGTRIAF